MDVITIEDQKWDRLTDGQKLCRSLIDGWQFFNQLDGNWAGELIKNRTQTDKTWTG